MVNTALLTSNLQVFTKSITLIKHEVEGELGTLQLYELPVIFDTIVVQFVPLFNEYCRVYCPEAEGKLVQVIAWVDNPCHTCPPLGEVTVISLLGLILNTALLTSKLAVV